MFSITFYFQFSSHSFSYKNEKKNNDQKIGNKGNIMGKKIENV